MDDKGKFHTGLNNCDRRHVDVQMWWSKEDTARTIDNMILVLEAHTDMLVYLLRMIKELEDGIHQEPRQLS